jgi:hypothetical protein
MREALALFGMSLFLYEIRASTDLVGDLFQKQKMLGSFELGGVAGAHGSRACEAKSAKYELSMSNEDYDGAT